jgi:hypothetical protein
MTPEGQSPQDVSYIPAFFVTGDTIQSLSPHVTTLMSPLLTEQRPSNLEVVLKIGEQTEFQ